MTTFEKVAESNRIEGIEREPTAEELVEHDRVMELENLTIRDIEKFVTVYQRNAKLRVNPGMDVRVGSYVPPKGGEHVREMLVALLDDINGERIDAWNAHIQYESIHPFTDGNGRSGRVIYHWQMRSTRMADLGFLHAFYYQTLQNCQTPRKIPRGSSSRIRGLADRGDSRSDVNCPEEAVKKYVVYKDPWHGPAKYEVRTEPGERTMAHCSSVDEAKRIAHALNTKPAWVSPEELVERAQAQAQPTVVTDPEILSGMPVFAGSRVPIDMVLACVDAGSDMARIRQAYPFVTDEHITAARAYKTSHPTPEFWQEASAIAVEYEGVGDLIRMYADAGDDAERLSIVIDIEELMADIKRAHP
jgi:uncharacterized protein (DUF433 family)